MSDHIDVDELIDDLVPVHRQDEFRAAITSQRKEAELEGRLKEAEGYCDDGHYHDKERDLAMLPSERIAELQAQANIDKEEE